MCDLYYILKTTTMSAPVSQLYRIFLKGSPDLIDKFATSVAGIRLPNDPDLNPVFFNYGVAQIKGLRVDLRLTGETLTFLMLSYPEIVIKYIHSQR